MFLCAVAMPGSIGNKFNVKLGCCPLVEVVSAKRDIKNRKKGTPVIQPIESINREVILRVLIEKLLPAIQLHYKNSKQKIIIQMDNSPSHFQGNEMDWENAVEKTGLDIVIKINHPSHLTSMFLTWDTLIVSKVSNRG